MGADRARRVTLLDGFAVHELPDDPAGIDLPRAARRLVAHLSLSGRPSRDVVAGRLWPDVPEPQAHASLRSTLWRLHRLVPGLIDASCGALSMAPSVRIDVTELVAWAQRVRTSTGEAVLVELLGEGLRGDLLPGWYDDWVLLERERLRQLRLHTLETLAEKLAASGRYGEALQAAYASIRVEPLRESAHRVVVQVHLAEGNLAEAVRAYHHFQVMLREELGVAPTEEMTRLVRGLAPPCRAG